MTGKPKKPAEEQPTETPQPKQQVQDDGSSDQALETFAQTEPPAHQ